ncbi:MAG: trypsin-like peptidase domain-containing protein [Anaerolineae bacterium]|nr:trypsin-like peptidase domain-containing protein [Anaerolineae bacterium]
MDLTTTFTQSLDELIQQVMPSLVVVRGRRRGAGAGFIWSSDGLILTNSHVVARHAPRLILQDEQEYKSQLLARDPNVDLALLSIEASGLTPLKPASGLPRVGEMVFAFGHPWGQRNSVTKGIVSALMSAHTRRKKQQFPVIRSDVPLAPGNSGGPLVNMRGEMIGINAMIMGGDQSIAIPASVVVEFVDRFISKKSGKAHRDKYIPEGVL